VLAHPSEILVCMSQLRSRAAADGDASGEKTAHRFYPMRACPARSLFNHAGALFAILACPNSSGGSKRGS